ncbi:MAG: PP2C family protein-serine/threonine phosphatase [Planctomycetota bacterium]|nr:PP2C family protein-serine/threonine phosphatase [Planctomycetota bacterium]
MPAWLKSLSRVFKGKRPLAELLPQLLDPGDPRIVIRPLGGDWLCPYTARRVLVPDWDGSSLTVLQCPEVMQHLLSLPQLEEKGLKAQMRSWEELVQLTALMRIKEAPSYNVTSEKGEWVCPHCMHNTGVIRQQWDGTDAPLSWFVPEVLKHLQACQVYLDDPLAVKSVTELMALQGEGAIRVELAKRVATDPVFRVCDDTGAWICPFSERAIPAINLYRVPWGSAIQERIIEYLLSPECPGRYSRWQTDRTPQDLKSIVERLAAERAHSYAKQAAEREVHFLRQRLDSLKQTAASMQELKRDLEAARAAQMKMLPDRVPEIPGYEMAAYYEPSIQLGGDLYHFFNPGQGSTGFLIGDVSGHGVEAAVIMSMALKSFSVRSAALHSPAAVMLRVNTDLNRDLERGKFVSAFYAVLEHATGKLRCARAGHPPALLANAADGSLMALEGSGLVLGIGDNESFAKQLKEYQVVLPPGGLLLLYTDGVTEAMSPSRDEFTEQRLQEALLYCAAFSPKEIVDYLVSTIREHTGPGPLADDMTLVALKRLGSS